MKIVIDVDDERGCRYCPYCRYHDEEFGEERRCGFRCAKAKRFIQEFYDNDRGDIRIPEWCPFKAAQAAEKMTQTATEVVSNLKSSPEYNIGRMNADENTIAKRQREMDTAKAWRWITEFLTARLSMNERVGADRELLIQEFNYWRSNFWKYMEKD